VVFLEIGQDVSVKGDLRAAVNEGVRRAYTEGYLRKSMVVHPFSDVRTPAIIPRRSFTLTSSPATG
jgi:fumarate hydratase subunit alpha